MEPGTEVLLNVLALVFGVGLGKLYCEYIEGHKHKHHNHHPHRNRHWKH